MLRKSKGLMFTIYKIEITTNEKLSPLKKGILDSFLHKTTDKDFII